MEVVESQPPEVLKYRDVELGGRCGQREWGDGLGVLGVFSDLNGSMGGNREMDVGWTWWVFSKLNDPMSGSVGVGLGLGLVT